MYAIISLLVVVIFSVLITRIATIALSYTGLSRETAKFQARSALTGTGFTTNETERVVNHPVRRRIVFTLMLIGNVGIVGAISSLILTFINTGQTGSMTLRIVLLVAGLVVLWAVASSKWVDRRLSRLIGWALKRYTRLDVTDYASLMHLAKEYRIVELLIEPQDWLAQKTLGEARLREEGIIVLGITRRNGSYLGAPKGTTQVFPEDTLIAYGRISALEALDQRRNNWRGRHQHRQAIHTQKKIEAEEEQQDSAETDQRS